MEEETAREILGQLRRQNRLAWVAIVILIAFVCIYIPFRVLGSHRRSAAARSEPSWAEVGSLMDEAQYDKAMLMTRTLIEKSPDYYYGYSFLGGIYLAKGNFASAEQNFAKAYELFPTEENEKSLLAVRTVLAKQRAE